MGLESSIPRAISNVSKAMVELNCDLERKKD